ncbi:MAG: phosphate signaling complex protein PhoU [Balneolales bacterium]
MRSAFQEHLRELESELFNMGDMVITSINRSVSALKEQKLELAKQIRRDDSRINDKRWQIEEQCIHLIATQQPVATQLREIIAVLSIITDLERMGDYAAGIAKIVIKMGEEPPVKPLIDIPRMAEIATAMIKRSLDAYAGRDAENARLISADDDKVDELYHQLLRELISIMIENPRIITRCTYLMWTAHNLERIGDRVTNICERIIFLVTGELVENLDKPENQT